MRRRRRFGLPPHVGLPNTCRPAGFMTAYSKLRTSSVWLPVHHASGASSDTQDAADELATQLGRMASPDPVRAAETGAAAIVVSVDSALGSDFRTYRDHAIIRIVGKSERGVRLGVWDLLRRLGHGRYGTTAEWEIVPALGANIDVHLPGPVYYQFRFFTGFGSAGGLMPPQQPRLETWRTENSIEDDGDWNTGHSYALYIADRDPPTDWKSTTGNKLHAEIPALVADYVAWQVDRLDDKACVSSSAADGLGGWSEIPQSPSDTQVILANATAAAGVQTAILAYGFMSAKPTVRLDPAILVVVATLFIQYGLDFDQVLAGYIAAGATRLAVYEYPFVWNFQTKNLPGADRGTQRSELVTLLARLSGCIGLQGEGGPVWGVGGRYYNAVAAALRGEDALAAWDSFPATVFPSAPTEAAAVYDILATRVTIDDTVLETLDTAVLALNTALALAGADEQERCIDLARYAVFCHLWVNYRDDDTVANFDDFLHWATRISNRDLCDYKSIYNDSVLEADRLAVAALYDEEDITAFTPPWEDSDEIPDASETLALLVSL